MQDILIFSVRMKSIVVEAKATVLEVHNLNKAILEAITTELKSKINNLSTEFSWRYKFAFISPSPSSCVP